MITLRFVAHRGIFSWIVKAFQYGFWPSHVETEMPEGGLLGASFWGKGVVNHPIGYDTGDFYQESFLQIPATPEQEEIFYTFLRSQIGKPYDWTAIISFLIWWRDWHEEDSWTCSELVAIALSKCGLFPDHLVVGFNRITLRDILLISSTLVRQ